MGSVSAVSPSADFRRELFQRGGASAARCYQCATCSSVCELAPPDAPFPRRQMLWAQWGLESRVTADPAIWLCHQCNDCTARCPREADPGDVMQALRAMTVQRVAVPRFLGRMVANAAMTWPILLGVPIVFWVLALWAVHGLTIPEGPLVYHTVVPHWLIYSVYFPVAGYVTLVAWLSGQKLWRQWGAGAPRSGSFFSHLVPALLEVATHKRFGSCGPAQPRKLGHLALFWGFVGAAVTSALLIVAMYGMGEEMPLPQVHPFKILGNISAVLLVVGGVWLAAKRMRDERRTGKSTAFDSFFLALVMLVIATGVLVEMGRYWFTSEVAVGLYIVHLGSVLCLFLTFPYSKFAHLLYRTLAMVHERMAAASQRR